MSEGGHATALGAFGVGAPSLMWASDKLGYEVPYGLAMAVLVGSALCIILSLLLWGHMLLQRFDLIDSWPPFSRRVPLHVAARLAYEAAEKAGILHLTTGENVSADAKLNHFKLLFIVDDETRVFGIKPPSTRIRLLPKEELRKDMYPAEGDVSKLVYQWPRGGDLADVAYTDVAIRRKDLRRVICQVVWEGRSREAPPYPDLWHERAMLKATLNVRCSRRSRRRCCGAVTTGFDPKRKSGGPKCCDAQPGFFDDG